ncbi:MAG: hypothetical protein IT190_07390 [Microbacteriaceae bacterium]|nr:hypothetical protein [Microbacteriaceae bacterium]
MKAYGIKRNYNATDDFLKNAEARSRTTQAKLNRIGRRYGRHTAKNALRLIKKEL